MCVMREYVIPSRVEKLNDHSQHCQFYQVVVSDTIIHHHVVTVFKAYPRSRLNMLTSLLKALVSLSISKSRRLSKEMYSTANGSRYSRLTLIVIIIIITVFMLPLLRISHLLVLRFFSTGRESRNSSNSSFISFRLLRSASL